MEFGIAVMLEGSDINARDFTSSNALSPIKVTEEGIVTFLRYVLANANCPIEVTDEGIVIYFRFEQYWKAKFGIFKTVEGITTNF